MDRLKNLGLKQAYFLFAFCGLAAALILLALLLWVCGRLQGDFPGYAIIIQDEGLQVIPSVTSPGVDWQYDLFGLVQLAGCVVLPVAGLIIASLLFYRFKLMRPIALLQSSTERIYNQDLDFTIPAVSNDELGQLCVAFETMRGELRRTNQELWQQAEERKRLNAAFSHDLRNPITVLKGSVKLLRQRADEPPDEAALNRLEEYTLRIEQYIEAMSSVQRLEQLPVHTSLCSSVQLEVELTDTAQLLAPCLQTDIQVRHFSDIKLDHSLFLTVAENLIANAARFAQSSLGLKLWLQDTCLFLQVWDDGPGYPPELLTQGPRPFGKMQETAAHFGMGLYICQMLCRKHGGDLQLSGRQPYGAMAEASWKVDG